MLIQMLCSILIALDTSSLVYKGFCTSFVATLLGHHSWLRHSVMTQFNVATHDVQKPIYTREEVSNVILLFLCTVCQKDFAIYSVYLLCIKVNTRT